MEGIIKDEELNADATGGLKAQDVEQSEPDVILQKEKEKEYIIEADEIQVGPIPESYVASVEARQFGHQRIQISAGTMSNTTHIQQNPSSALTPVITPHYQGTDQYHYGQYPGNTNGQQVAIGGYQQAVNPIQSQQIAYMQAQVQHQRFHPYGNPSSSQQQYFQQWHPNPYQQYHWQQWQQQYHQWQHYQRQIRRQNRLERRGSRESRRARDSRPFSFELLTPIRFEPNAKRKDEPEVVEEPEVKPMQRRPSATEGRDSLDILADCAASLTTYNV